MPEVSAALLKLPMNGNGNGNVDVADATPILLLGQSTPWRKMMTYSHLEPTMQNPGRVECWQNRRHQAATDPNVELGDPVLP